jgi:hypothetical protein
MSGQGKVGLWIEVSEIYFCGEFSFSWENWCSGQKIHGFNFQNWQLNAGWDDMNLYKRDWIWSRGKHVGWFIFDCQAFVCLSPTRDRFFVCKSIGWVAFPNSLEQNLLDNFNFLLFSFWVWWRRARGRGLDGQTRNEISNYFLHNPCEIFCSKPIWKTCACFFVT